jgi:putative flippase GtrA
MFGTVKMDPKLMKTIACKEISDRNGFNSQTITSQFGKYFVVGGIAALTEWFSYSSLIFLLNWNYLLAAIIAFFIATAVNYWLSIRFVFFQHRYKFKSEFLLVYIVSGIGAITNLSALAVLVEWGDVNVYLSKIISTGIAFLWNFLSRRYWVFVD